MDITKFVVTSREKALLYGDYATYRTQLSGKLLNCRKKLNIATKNRGKFHPKTAITPEQIAENTEYVRLQLLTAERAWAHAMAMKAAHSANTKGMTGRTRSHIVSRLEKGARIAEKLAQALSDGASGASPTDILDARAYAALLRGAALFEKQNWGACLKSYAICRIIYTALATSSKGDIFKELLSDTIDPSMRFAAYQAKIPRTLPIATIAHRAFEQSDAELVDSIKTLNPAILEQGDIKERKAAEGAPTTLTWRGRQVKIEDAVISAAWGAVDTVKEQLAQKLASSSSLRPKEMAAAYDDILIASQDAVDATKQAIDELKAEGVAPSDPRMQSLQITRTAVNYEMISWRIGRNRVLAGERDGAKLDLGAGSKQKKGQTDASSTERRKYETPGRQIARLKEKVVLYDGILQNVESIKELPGIANDEELSARLDATSKYFTALKSLAISRSHAIAGNAVNALALIKHGYSLCHAVLPVLNQQAPDETDGFSPRNIAITKQDLSFLHDTMSGELHRARALVEIFSKLPTPPYEPSTTSQQPLSARLSEYPSTGDVDLSNIVSYPPRLETFPVKPLFLDVAWNYIEYPDKSRAGQQAEKKQVSTEADQQKAAASEPEPAPKPQKRGWFSFGR